jgi:hypothetical protein
MRLPRAGPSLGAPKNQSRFGTQRFIYKRWQLFLL